jgi:mRNA capping enzyme
MDLRKLHNLAKREFINDQTREGMVVLDAGCGCGGDLLKWGHHNITVYACDPNVTSILEARKRSKGKTNFHFFNGDISHTPVQPYDIICYNFSLQYIFVNEQTFRCSIDNICARSKVGTVFMGVVPDSDAIFLAPDSVRDANGNEFHKGVLSGEFSDRVRFFVKDSPYYACGAITEPVCHKDLLMTFLGRAGFECTTWTPFISFSTGTITDMYSKFVFTKTR